MRRILPLVGVLLTACSVSSSDTSAESAVTSVATATRLGSTIRLTTGALPPGVDPALEYAPLRSIDFVIANGKLTTDERAVIERADRIVASTTHDGRISVDELAQLASPENVVVLSPAERNALATVWRVMFAPKVVVAAAPEPPPHALPITPEALAPVRSAPTPLALPPLRTVYRIDEAGSASQRAIAVRVEYGFDDDGDNTSISFGDLDHASASTAFTPAEITSMSALRRALTAIGNLEIDAAERAAPRTMHAIAGQALLDGPEGVTNIDLPLANDVVYRVVCETTYREHRKDEQPVSLDAEQTFRFEIASSKGAIAHLTEAGEDTNLELDPATTGTYELWIDGLPQSRVLVPLMPKLVKGNVGTNLDDLIGFKLVSVDHAVIDRYISDDYGEYRWTAFQRPGERLANLDYYGLADRRLPPPSGSYEGHLSDGIPWILDAYPEGAIFLTVGGAPPLHLLPEVGSVRWKVLDEERGIEADLDRGSGGGFYLFIEYGPLGGSGTLDRTTRTGF